MARLSKTQTTGLIGKYVIDIFDYDSTVMNYLIDRGATSFDNFVASKLSLKAVSFQGCKPSCHFLDGTARLFFPSEDEAVLFSVAFGHKIQSSYVKTIQNLIDDIADK